MYTPVMMHERQQNVHQRTGDHHHGALPALSWPESCPAARRIFVARLFAEHADIAAKRDSRDAEIGVPSTPAEKPRPETNAERFNADSDGNRRPIVTQFVDHYHHAQQDQNPPDVLNH